MPEIQNLSITVDHLQNAFKFWNRWALGFTLAAAVAAVGYFVTSWLANRKAEQLNEAQSTLIAAKDRQSQITIQELQTESDKSKEQIAKAQAAAAQANLKAAELTAKAEKTNLFVQGLAQQQQGMSQQIQGTPAIDEPQINAIVLQLKPFAGQRITIHSTMDTPVERLGNQFKRIFDLARIPAGYSIDMGSTYRGVMVVVKDAANPPPFANTLLRAIQSISIPAQGGHDPKAADSTDVSLFLGPN
ncbi:MAG: hypothetical protein ACRD59_17005 [Candidatus Acidiferrales bacterium]